MRQWILLRGLTRETAHWGGLVADLQQALPGDAVLAVDLPGNGQCCHRPSPTTVQGMVQACMQCGRGRHGCTAFRACHCARVWPQTSTGFSWCGSGRRSMRR